MIKVKPLSPEDIDNKELSDELVERVNNLIRMNWNGHSAEIIIDHITCLHPNQNGEMNWRAICRLYKKYGWDVETDFPGYCENYKAKLIFRKKRK